jgi:hypothetical protein
MSWLALAIDKLPGGYQNLANRWGSSTLSASRIDVG